MRRGDLYKDELHQVLKPTDVIYYGLGDLPIGSWIINNV